jgi:hypothetical protein
LEKKMKRKIKLSIALCLSLVLVSLMSSDSTVTAQNQIRLVADTGVVTLCENQTICESQTLRLTVTGEAGTTVSFRVIGYTKGACDSAGVCRLVASSQNTTDPITLMPGEAVTVDRATPKLLRVMVLSNNRNARVNASIIDAATGNTTAIIGILIAL